jgi:SAM-dependent methyltransferase
MNPDLEWQRRYEAGDTPWDKGMAAPPLIEFLRRSPITGRVLVPGCGRGHDARALAAQPKTEVIGLDISPAAISGARQFPSTSALGSSLAFVEGDFFNLPASFADSFDWLVEHTCFCAIDPAQRSDYVRAAARALRPAGQIFAIFYLDPGSESGPPVRVSREELSELFGPSFDVLDEWVPQESFPGREGRELVRHLKKR